MEKKKYIKFIKNKREMGKIILYLLIAFVLIFSMKTLAATILASSESVIADEKTAIRTAVAVSRGASSSNVVEIESLTTELGKYASTEVRALSAERIQVEFERTGNIYEIDVNHGPIFDLLNGSIPYLPLGYTPVQGTDLESGLVIEDLNGNQFVWVEVPKTTTVYQTAGLEIKNFTSEEFEKIENDLLTYTSVYRNGTAYTDIWSSEDSTGLTEREYNTLKKKMLKSIYKNGGFYVGRYETGTTTARTSAGATTTTPVIKQNEYPYNYVTPTLAQTLSESFAISGYTSSLMFGVQWDLVLKYLETKGAATQSELITDSRPCGNFKANTFNVTDTNAKYYTASIGGWTNSAYGYKASGEAVLLSLGASEIFKKQNIYDLAGNMWEMTLEQTNEATKRAVVRGGNCSDNGGYTANYRAGTSTNVFLGFRVCLYKDEGTYTADENNKPPYIPNGYTAVDGTMDTGFVIADSSGNEYVWVEVPKTVQVYQTAGLSITTFTEDEFNRIENDLHTYTSVYRDGVPNTDTWSSEVATGLTESEYNIQKKKMLKSIYKNGGFYVGRYETGITTARTSASDSLGTPAIKQNVYPYNFVTVSQSQTLAESFATTGYQTSLMFGVQWDLILKHIELSGEVTVDQLKTDSTSWGNYRDSIFNITNTSAKYSGSDALWTNGAYGQKTSGTKVLLSPGASETFKKQNIYDIAGNSWEWTLENTTDSSKPIVARGGGLGDSSEMQKASYRGRDPYTHIVRGNTFRVCLYKDEGTSTLDTPTYIPYGYTHLAGTDMETGFVIHDEKGNEYVWVEVPRTAAVYATAGTNVALFTDAEFTAIENDLRTYSANYSQTWAEEEWDSLEVTGLTESEYNVQKKKMLKSIYKNGGFYIGRYETGIDYSKGARTAATNPLVEPVIKQNAYPYNWVTGAEAQKLSESFATSGYETNLLFGVQWNLTMKYLEVVGGLSNSQIKTDSTSWGNYYTSTWEVTNSNSKYSTNHGATWTSGAYGDKSAAKEVFLTTGASGTFSKQNIYDLGGNVYEWTLEKKSGYGLVPRGNYCGSSEVAYSASISAGGQKESSWFRGFRVSLYKDEGIGITAAYIPEGYTQVSGTNLDNGLVVKDATGNEYVWVKVPRTVSVYATVGLNIESFTDAELTKIENDLHTYTSIYRDVTKYKDTWSSETATGLTQSEYNGLKKIMLKSVYLNGGFYVGRYETGTTTARTSSSAAITSPVIKQDVYPYNYITTAKAQELSTGFATTGYETSLMFGIQWDLVLKHLENNGMTQEELKGTTTGSVTWGNYNNALYNITNTNSKYYTASTGWKTTPYGNKTAQANVLLSTGANEMFNRQNIYDFAGNLTEYTLLNNISSASSPCINRGGYFSVTGHSRPSSICTTNSPDYTANNLGFRVALYKDEGWTEVRSYDASNLDGNWTTGTTKTTIKDLTGSQDGTIYGGPTFGNGYISLNEGSATDLQYIDIGPTLNLSKVAVNCKFSVSEIVSGKVQDIVANTQTGGFFLYISSNSKIAFGVRREDGTAYEAAYSTTLPVANTIYDVTGMYDGKTVYLYVNGVLEGTKETDGGNIKNPTNGEKTIIGAEANGTQVESTYKAKMKLYSAKIWTAPAYGKFTHDIFDSLTVTAHTNGLTTWNGSKAVMDSSARNTNASSQRIRVSQMTSTDGLVSDMKEIRATGTYVDTFTKDSTFTKLFIRLNGNVVDTGIWIDVSTLTNGKTYKLEFDVTSYGTYKVTIENIRILE